MTEELNVGVNHSSTFENFWKPEELGQVNYDFSTFDFTSTFEINVQEQRYLIIGEGKEEIISALTASEAIGKSSIKNISKVQSIIVATKPILSKEEMTSKSTNN